jgi:hypothetical protein
LAVWGGGMAWGGRARRKAARGGRPTMGGQANRAASALSARAPRYVATSRLPPAQAPKPGARRLATYPHSSLGPPTPALCSAHSTPGAPLTGAPQPPLSTYTHIPPGMSAARQLRNWGYRVVVLEGHARLGGRVHGRRLEVRRRRCDCGGGGGGGSSGSGAAA